MDNPATPPRNFTLCTFNLFNLFNPFNPMKRLSLLLPLLALAAGCASPRAKPTELLVLAESGRPVAGVPVSWHERWGERRGFACVDKGVSGQCLTDEQGRAELPALEPGRRREVKIVLPANP